MKEEFPHSKDQTISHSGSSQIETETTTATIATSTKLSIIVEAIFHMTMTNNIHTI